MEVDTSTFEYKYVESVRQTKVFATAVIKNSEGKYLLIHELNDTWYFAGGRVDKGESFQSAVKRETEEEGGVNLSELAILRFEHNPDWRELRLMFFGVSNDSPKSKSDDESLEAVWESFENIKPAKYRPRDQEWIDAIRAVEMGAKSFPLSLLKEPVDSKIWSRSNAPDPWHFTPVAVITHEGKILVRISPDKKKLALPALDLSGLQFFETGLKQILKNLNQELPDINCQVDGILRMEHVPASKSGEHFHFRTYYSVSISNIPISTSKCEWLCMKDPMLESLPFGYSILKDCFDEQNKTCDLLVPTTIVVPGIYAPWKK